MYRGIEHVENFNLIIEEIYRSLKKGGRAVVTMPFITAEHEIPYDFRRLTSFGIKREFEKIGFKVKSLKKSYMVTQQSDNLFMEK